MLRKPTEIIRAMLTQEIRVVLAAESDAPPDAERVVQVLVPESPEVSIALDVVPKEVGPNRRYKLSDIPPNTQIQFRLMPHQTLAAVSARGNAACTLIVEYVND